MDRLYIDNDHLATLPDLTDDEGTSITGATVTLTLYAEDAVTEVSGVVWPVSLAHTTGGTYQGVLPKEAAVSEGNVYRAKITATASGKQFVGWHDAYATKRQI